MADGIRIENLVRVGVGTVGAGVRGGATTMTVGMGKTPLLGWSNPSVPS